MVFFFAEAGVLVGFRFFVVECTVCPAEVEYAVSPSRLFCSSASRACVSISCFVFSILRRYRPGGLLGSRRQLENSADVWRKRKLYRDGGGEETINIAM